MLYAERKNQRPNKFYIHCSNRNCNSWIEVDFNKLGGVSLQIMPQDVSFDVERIPVVVFGE